MRDAKLAKPPTDESKAGDILSLRRGGRTGCREALHRQIRPSVDVHGLLGIGLDMVEDVSEELVGQFLHLDEPQRGQALRMRL